MTITYDEIMQLLTKRCNEEYGDDEKGCGIACCECRMQNVFNEVNRLINEERKMVKQPKCKHRYTRSGFWHCGLTRRICKYETDKVDQCSDFDEGK